MDKLLVGSAQHLELDGGLRETDYLMLNLPFVCNYNCTKCCNIGRDFSQKDTSYLSLKEIYDLIDDAKNLGARVLVIAGEGEPFLDERTKRIIKKAYDARLISYVFTNGSLLTKKTVSLLQNTNASLVINLDSLTSDKYKELSGGRGDLSTVLENLKTVREIFSAPFSTIEKFSLRRIAINTVASEYNSNELKTIQKFCGDDFVWVCNTPMKIGNANSNNYATIIQNIPSDIIPLGTTFDNKWCAYLRNGISVGATGKVLTCAYSLESAGHLGNIRNSPLKQLMGKANQTVDKFYKKEGHSRCILRHPNYQGFLKGLRD